MDVYMNNMKQKFIQDAASMGYDSNLVQMLLDTKGIWQMEIDVLAQACNPNY